MTRSYRKFCFGSFELDERDRQLRLDGRPLRVARKVYQLISHLVRNSHRPVSKGEILDVVWEGRAVGETSIARCVSNAREILSDSGSSQHTIKTLHGHGYWFVAPVEEFWLEDASSQPAVRPFVGRNEEMVRLRAALDEAMSGAGRLVRIVGDAGIGKTRLSREIMKVAKTRGVAVLAGHCIGGEDSPAAWPWVEIMREIIDGGLVDAMSKVSMEIMADVALMVPELGGGRSRASGASEPDANAQRHRTFDGVSRLLRQATRAGPMVLFIDDLHRADVTSLDLLVFVSRQLTDLPVLVIASQREVGLRGNRHVGERLAALGRVEGCESIALRGLSENAVSELIQVSVGARAPAAMARDLRDRTEGNPLFVVQLLPLLTSTHSKERGWEATLPEQPLPESIRETVIQHLEGLSLEGRRLLMLGATTGREFQVTVVEVAAGSAAGSAIEKLEEAVDAGILEADPGRAGVYRFRHEVLREALYGQLSGAERVHTHGRIAEALESIHGGDLGPNLADVAHHAYRALPAGDSRKVIRLTVRAAEWASDHMAFDEAANHYRRALEVVDASRGIGDAPLCDLLLAAGAAQIRAGEREEARETLRRAAGLAERMGASERLAHVALGLAPGFFAIETGIQDRFLVGVLEEALVALSQRDSPLRVRLLSQLALALYWTDQVDRRHRLVDEARAVARRLGDTASQARAEAAVCAALWSPDNHVRRLADLRYVIRLSDAARDETLSLMSRVFGIATLLEAGELVIVDRDVSQLEQLIIGLRQPHAQWYPVLYRAMRMLMRGRYEEAEILAHESRALGERFGDVNVTHSFGAQLTEIQWQTGRSASALTGVRAYAESHPEVPAWRCAAAMFACECGRAADVIGEYESLSRQRFAAIPRDMNWLFSLVTLSEVALSLEDRHRSEILYELLVEVPQPYVTVGYGVVFWGSVRRVLGRLAGALGQAGTAIQHFEGAIAADQYVGATPFVAWDLSEYAGFLKSIGDSRWIELATESVTIGSSVGASRTAKRSRALLRGQ